MRAPHREQTGWQARSPPFDPQRRLLRAIAIALLGTPLPVVAAPGPMTLGGIVRTAFSGCDNPTPVRAPSGEVYSNVSDCSVGTSGRISTGWVKVDPVVGWVPSNLTAYGNGALARVPKGSVTNLAAWQVFVGSPKAFSWVSWPHRAARSAVLSDPGRIHRPQVSNLSGCWTMAVTMPPPPGTRGGNGLAVYTSLKPYGPWNRRYYVTGKNLGESAQFSPLWPGRLLLTEGDRFEWRSYSMPSGC